MARCNEYFFIAKFYEKSFGSFYDGKKLYLKDVITSAIPSVVDRQPCIMLLPYPRDNFALPTVFGS